MSPHRLSLVASLTEDCEVCDSKLDRLSEVDRSKVT